MSQASEENFRWGQDSEREERSPTGWPESEVSCAFCCYSFDPSPAHEP